MRWWLSFGEFLPQIANAAPGPGWQLYPEISLTAPLAGTRLVGKYDLVAVHPQGRLRIYDWKTSRQRSKRQTLEKRLQTRLYPYLLTCAGAFLNGGVPIQPEQVEMVYWFTEHPEQPERFTYSNAAFQADEAYLTSLIETVRRLEEADFTLTDDERQCAYCVYRSLCNRGVAAGDLADFDAGGDGGLPGFELDFEQIAEIAY
jgi:RecB family exonuclease